ncbi:hypothetical protein LEP1GSC021_1758 [Leptospira noguchii str. 1993005606]|nr:hypothetical protein LEP1GSC021_1758 [Leptospira noguchii str. 1993005606]
MLKNSIVQINKTASIDYFHKTEKMDNSFFNNSNLEKRFQSTLIPK